MKRFEHAMAAVAFAEAGEFETAREILKAGDETRKRVLLGINEGEMKPRLINYAYDLSQRVGGQLEVLQLVSPSNAGRILEYMNDPKIKTMRDKGIAYKIISGLGSIEENLLAYAREQRNILLVLLKNIGTGNTEIDPMEIMGKLRCPVVVFSEMM